MASNPYFNATSEDVAAAVLIRQSALFDAAFYVKAAGAEAAADPALHYLLVGEQAGRDPSPAFSVERYVRLNPDLRQSSINRLLHYETHGRREARSIVFRVDALDYDASRIDPGRPTVVLLLHEASYSGAPILGWNVLRELKLTRNVVVILRKGGPLEAALRALASAVIGPPPAEVMSNPMELDRLAERVMGEFHPVYALANSVETRMFAVALRSRGLPMVALIHEFESTSQPYELKEFYKSSDALVFGAKLVLESSLRAYEILNQRFTHILPQGPSEIPRLGGASHVSQDDTLEEGRETLPLLPSSAEEGRPFTVIGLGSIDLRKGVDLFIATATSLQAKWPALNFRFVWVGEQVHDKKHQYVVYIKEQIQRSGLAGKLNLYSPVDDLDPIYAAADAIFISSRLDPLPNVGIDACMRGVPLLCFENATGFAELLLQNQDLAWLVAPYLDTAGIADRLAALAQDRGRQERAREAIRQLGFANFNMMRYVRRLDEIGRAAAQRSDGLRAQAETLMPLDAFNADLYLGEASKTLPREAAVLRYLDDCRNVDFSGPAVWGDHPRRALEGFHPLIYGSEAPDFPPGAVVNPLVHFIRAGRPEGPWKHPVIRLERSEAPVGGPRTARRAAIHGHFHYVDNFPEFIAALMANRGHYDLFLTTTSAASAEVLRSQASAYQRGKVSISVMSNLGRDIRPFINLLDQLAEYDVAGHVHGKRSLHTAHYDRDLGDRWRVFLWQHLLGPAAPAADIIVDEFIADPGLGMVFPENDHLVGWELNRALAEELAPRLGLKCLPAHLEFPVGTMFWCRPKALANLKAAAFADADYPPEVLPIDGTMLHALERMLPLIVKKAGYSVAATYFREFAR